MPKRGRTPKPPERRQGHRKGNLVPVPDARPDPHVPPPPAGLSAAWRKHWTTYWTSEVAGAAHEVDLPAICRLFLLYDEWERCWVGYRKSRVVEGSTGQLVINPLGKQAQALAGQISALEADLGLTPLARSRLGIAIGQAKLTAAELNRMVTDSGEAAQEDDTGAIEAAGWQEAE